MPELPEVETIVRDLRSLVIGRRIETVRVRLNKLVRTGPRRLVRLATGAEILAVKRRGKFIVFSLSAERYIIVHLKMTGQFLWGEFQGVWPDYVHVITEFENGKALLYRDMRQFGYFLGLEAQEYAEWLKSQEIGPDPFQLTSAEFAGLLRSKKGRIKAVLLDQRVISGLGNIYCDEALFAAGVHPLHPAHLIEEDLARRLHEQILKILKEAIRCRGSTTRNYVGLAGVGGEYQNRHRVYGRGGENCLVCGCRISRITAAGRGTHFCPVCQPQPVRASDPPGS